MEELLFTPSAVFALLSQIDELQDVDIETREEDDKVVFAIGNKEYQVDFSESVDVEAEPEDIQLVDEANEVGYEDVEDDNVDALDSVEGGILKELAKTLAIGGLVRLTSGMIKNN